MVDASCFLSKFLIGFTMKVEWKGSVSSLGDMPNGCLPLAKLSKWVHFLEYSYATHKKHAKSCNIQSFSTPIILSVAMRSSNAEGGASRGAQWCCRGEALPVFVPTGLEIVYKLALKLREGNRRTCSWIVYCSPSYRIYIMIYIYMVAPQKKPMFSTKILVFTVFHAHFGL